MNDIAGVLRLFLDSESVDAGGNSSLEAPPSVAAAAAAVQPQTRLGRRFPSAGSHQKAGATHPEDAATARTLGVPGAVLGRAGCSLPDTTPCEWRGYATRRL